ncbi:DUF4406 domain-containing protein [Mesorhizobium sp. M7A.F.Ca.CA.002.14.1.2]|uniref:DUF4406 domain-containing protein n=1 Tax=Mesorhizobium sp. M7A.F.Ca.CA.002.14.1.2 TaxID=2496740 RepID=UPI000FCB72B3|nr:DUF4406 domain-containing protein [Mesorhizobium sp. M7A.F.Ca.CA.002.14.1.2]RUX13769.1 DUF4406 domain-containing protein [Mesorhizobium sp. M7A.F.Ca.CA.002.14.1.2]
MTAQSPQPLSGIRQAWRSAFGSRKVVYLSGPITSGLRFIDWWSKIGYQLEADASAYRAELVEQVIIPNENQLKATAELLRARGSEPVVEPASLFINGWTQEDYLELWQQFISAHASRILLMDGWEYSAGSASEFCRAHLEGIPTARVDGSPIVARDGVAAISRALARVDALAVPPLALQNTLRAAYSQLETTVATVVYVPGGGIPRKDASLDRLAELINVAQFVSYEPHRGKPKQAYSRVLGESPNRIFSNVTEVAETLLARSADGSVNVRSFTPESPLSREFIYGLTRVNDIVDASARLTREGLHTIVNETVDIHDGGVSGVVLGKIIEFAPDDTPRAVEKAGTASLPLGWGFRLLATVYGFEPDLAVPENTRLEFSLHPRPRGWRRMHTLGWEIAEHKGLDLFPVAQWPNRFSHMLGDKVFGLLVAHLIGLPVPRTTVVNRRVAPFTFGQATGSSEVWCRTAPIEQTPGKFTTTRGWSDPFRIMQEEDPDHKLIASILGQASVEPLYSGASIVLQSGEIVTEGLRGVGDRFMLGTAKAEILPSSIIADVERLHAGAAELGPVRFEWVHDGKRAWVVQMHHGATKSAAGVLVPGKAEHWIVFDVSQGLEKLRDVIDSLEPHHGVELQGEVGLTSHIADVIRRANVPARMKPQDRDAA